MYTKIEVRAYTRVLKKKLLELKKEREKKIKQFAKDAAAWRRLVLEWIDLNAEVRVMAIRDSQLHTRHYITGTRVVSSTTPFSRTHPSRRTGRATSGSRRSRPCFGISRFCRAHRRSTSRPRT